MIAIEKFINRFNPCDLAVEYLTGHKGLSPYEIWNKCMQGNHFSEVPKLLYWYNNCDDRPLAFCAGVCHSVLTGVVFEKITHM